MSTTTSTTRKHLLAEPVHLETPARVRRPKTAKFEPRLTGEPFDPARVSKTLSPRA